MKETISFATKWQLLFVAPVWAYLAYRTVLSMSIELTIDATELRWRSLTGRGVADVGLISAVEAGPRWGHGSVRVIDIADGQRVRVGEGPEFDRLLRALRMRVSDLEVRL